MKSGGALLIDRYASDATSLTNFKSTNPRLVTQSKLTATAQTMVAAGRMRRGNILVSVASIRLPNSGSEKSAPPKRGPSRGIAVRTDAR
jgi:hypothetical protein